MTAARKAARLGNSRGQNKGGRAWWIFLLLLLSLSKGWFVIIVVPLLIIVVPILIMTRNAVERRAAQGPNDAMTALSKIQFYSVLLFYVCLPGATDGDVLLFFIPVNEHLPIVGWSILLSYLGAFAFIIASIALFIRFLMSKPLIAGNAG
jgi:hypothetical protein